MKAQYPHGLVLHWPTLLCGESLVTGDSAGHDAVFTPKSCLEAERTHMGHKDKPGPASGASGITEADSTGGRASRLTLTGRALSQQMKRLAISQECRVEGYMPGLRSGVKRAANRCLGFLESHNDQGVFSFGAAGLTAPLHRLLCP